MVPVLKLVKNSIGWPVGDEDVDRGDVGPDLVGVFERIVEPHPKVVGGVGGAEKLQSLYLHRVVLQVDAQLFQFGNFFLRVHHLVGLPGVVLTAVLVGFRVDAVVVVSSDDYFVLAGDLSEELPELFKLFFFGASGEVAGVDEDICLGKLGDIYFTVFVVRI